MDVTDYKLDGLREQIGFVLQDTVLFAGTIRDNIAYGRPDATPEEIIEAAKMANAHEFISQMPHGYDSLVGERGLTLSGGQRQRIGIARAVVRNSPILILDEPTAALDTESEKLVMEALERLMKGRTVITIAHRLSTIRDADKIVVLKGGFVAEEGTHDELIKRNEIYAELYRIQAGSTPAAGVAAQRTPSKPVNHHNSTHVKPLMSDRSLIVLPDEPRSRSSTRSTPRRNLLRVKMFVFSDPDLLKAVIAAHKTRGQSPGHAQCRPPQRRGRQRRDAARRSSTPASRSRTATPSSASRTRNRMVVDEEIAFVKSLNWATKNLTETRDYAIVTTHPHEVDEIIACFEADWHREGIQAGRARPSDLVPRSTAASASPSSSTTPSTRSSSRTSATRTPSSSSASSAPRCAASRSTSWRARRIP